MLDAYSLNIGLTNRCNLKCSFCPIKNTKIKREDMSFELAKKIIDEAEITHHISLALFGESTLYEKLPDVIAYIKKKKPGLKTILYTNGVLVDKSLANSLTSSKLDQIIFSIDSFNSYDYRLFKGADNFDQLIKNVKYFASLNKTKVRSQFADLNYHSNEKEAKLLIDELTKCTEIKLGRFISWGGEIKWNGKKDRVIRKNKPCVHVFMFMNIASNGNMVMCCMDYNHSVVLGNVKNENVMSVWNGSLFNNLRERQKKGNFDNICLNCENESYYCS